MISFKARGFFLLIYLHYSLGQFYSSIIMAWIKATEYSAEIEIEIFPSECQFSF